MQTTTQARLWVGTVTAFAAMMLAACSGSEEDSGESTNDESSESGDTDGGDDAYDGPGELTVAMSGDVLLHNTTWATAEADAAAAGKEGMDFAPMFAPIKPLISGADFSVCHMETPLGPPEGPFENYPVFSVPPQVIPALQETGYDMCTTASNHSVDKGFEGVARTVSALDKAGMPYAGTAKRPKAARKPTLVGVEGAQVAVLSYTFGTNGMPVEKPWSVNLIDPKKIKRDAAEATRMGADLVLVALHDGTEYLEEPTSGQRATVEAITRSPDIDLVYGHHAHVSQPFEVVNGKWVAYGLGNFIAQQDPDQPETYRGTTAKFTLARRDDGGWDVSDARFIPTQITLDGEYAAGMRVLNAPAALRDPETPEALRGTLQETIDAVRTASFSLGARRDGLRMGR